MNYKFVKNLEIKCWEAERIGYDRNRNIRQEPEPEPEFRLGLAGTGSDSKNSDSGFTNRKWYAQIVVPAGYGPILVVA